MSVHGSSEQEEAAPMPGPCLLSTSQAAARLGVHPQTLRKWERIGIVPAVARRRGRRVYTPGDLCRIKAAVFAFPSVQEVRP